MTSRPLAVAVAACLLIAVASLAVAHEPVYDAWAWLVWGRELAGLDLDTSSGPSWKPLPVAIAAALSLAGDAAPGLWLLLVRAAWLLAVVLAGGLAHRLTRGVDRRLRAAAAAGSGLTLLLLADGFTSWARQGAAGMSEPLLVALVLATVVAALVGRSRLALALAALAALVRPEAWPLLGAYGLWLWRAEPPLQPQPGSTEDRGWLGVGSRVSVDRPRIRRVVSFGARPIRAGEAPLAARRRETRRIQAQLAAAALAVPALWIVPDLVVAGDASAGGRALRGGGAPLHEALEALWRAAAMPLAAAWPLALVAVASAGRHASVAGGLGETRQHASRFSPNPPPAPASADRALRVLAAGALGWIAVVAAMAAAGFPGLPRFMAPAIAIVGVLAGVGLARLLATSRRPLIVGGLSVALVATALELPGRLAELPRAITTTARIAHSHDRLRALTRDVGGREPLLRCGKLATSDVLVRTALAWELGVPLSEVVSFGLPPTRSGAFVVGPQASARVRARLRERGELLGRRGEWRVYSLDCSATATATAMAAAPSASARSTGVSGARR